MKTDTLDLLRPRPRARGLLVAPALLCAACATAPPPETTVPLEKSPAPASPGDPDDDGTVTLISAARPAKLAVDGDLSEWGSLDPPPAKAKSKAEKGKGGKDEGTGAAKSSAGPRSHVAAALHPEGLSVAARLSAKVGQGFWLLFAMDIPDVPNIGMWMRGGGVMALPCATDGAEEQMDAEDLASCKKLLDRHEAFSAAYLDRFEVFYRVEPSGVSVLRGDKLVPVEGAKVAFKPAEGGFAAEASLPVRGLPRTLQAPVEHFTGYAAAVRGPTPPASPTAEPVWLDTPAPVGFEPHAELRASVFQQAQRRLSYSGYKPFGISYQPGDDLEVEDCLYVGGDSQVVGTEPKILYSKQMTMGDLEVGYAYTGTAGPSAAVLTSAMSLHKAKPVAVVDLFGEPKGIVQRDGEVHVITYLSESFVDSPGESGEWSAVAFGPDGTPREEIVERAPHVSWGFLSVVESSAPDFSTFGFSAVTMSDQHVPGDTVELTWTYDKKERYYRVSVKEPPAAGPKKSKPKKK